MAGPALFRGRIRSSVVSRGRSPEQAQRHASSCVRQGCLLSAKEKGVGWRLEEDGECLKSLLQRVKQREAQDGKGRRCEGSLEVGVGLYSDTNLFSLQEDECNN